MSESIIVTGGLGYIGTAVSAVLANAGFQPVIVDNLTTSLKSVSEFPVVQGNYGDPETLDKTLEFKPVASIHLANSAYVGESMSDPMKYFSNNVARTADFLQWCTRNGIRKTVFSSSCATYGAPDVEKITEETPQEPINPYGESKLMIESMLNWLDLIQGHSSIALRYFNVAGSSLISSAVDAHDPEPHLLPRLIGAAKNKAEFVINGNDFNTPDGSAIRDFIHVDDLARGHLLSLLYLLKGGSSTKLNLGTGIGTSVLQLAAQVEKRFGPIRVRVGERRPGDPARLVASAKKANETLNWRPVNSGIDQILDSIIS